ncbi:hypothetical protein CANARDRAFT_196787 [[Candida] arabinofermentans NRRL YB-2248]|uniref:Chloride channel protein n=1 Tax=[Candida] arabinofermentans NRRL YB-2248 TaxID=983967 RepID=A0A1E4T3A3_9ASCO|nr:hypothetical protein CANARDRAFT_196787 [[Candida] arabinofermentans NRRL YB-2248]
MALDSNDSEFTRLRQYNNFSIIDWNYEYSTFTKFNQARLHASSTLQRFIYTNLRWIILISASFLMGVITILIDYLSNWLHGLRFNVCTAGFWKTSKTCEESSLLDWSSSLFKFIHGNSLKIVSNFFVYISLSICFALAAAFICVKYGTYARKSGIPEMKLVLVGFYIKDFFQIRMIIHKTISLILVISSGIFLGFEGPLVHISCGVLNYIIDLFPNFTNANHAIKRELLSSGIAIGIGLAFNAPIGGVLFGLEQIQSFFPIDKLMWNAFICSTLSVTFLQKLHPFRTVEVNKSFEVNLKNNWLYMETFPYMFLGLICGLFGILFNKLNIHFAKMRRSRIGKHDTKLQIIEVLAIVIITSLVSYPNFLTNLTLPELLENLFTDCHEESTSPICQLTSTGEIFPYKSVGLLLFTTLQIFLLTSYTYGCSIPGGVLMPSLVIGGLIGRLIGTILEYIQYSHPTASLFLSCHNENKQCISAASYSLVGAGSFLAAVTKMNVTVVVLLSEVTGALTYIIPIMLGVLFARFLNDMMLDNSIYELWLIASGQPYLASNLEDNLSKCELATIGSDKLMVDASQLSVLYDDYMITLDTLIQMSSQCPSRYGYPVLKSKENPQLIGHITWYEMSLELEKVKNDSIVSMDTVVQFSSKEPGTYSLQHLLTPINDLYIISSSFNVLTVYEIIDKLKIPNLFLCYNNANYQFKGMINRDDLIEMVNEVEVDKEFGTDDMLPTV